MACSYPYGFYWGQTTMWFYTAPTAKEIGLNVCCDFGVILFCCLSCYCLCVHSLSQYRLPLVRALCAPVPLPIFNLLNSDKVNYGLFHIYCTRLLMKVEIRGRFQANWICHPIIQWDLRAHISFHSTRQKGRSSNRFQRFANVFSAHLLLHATACKRGGSTGIRWSQFLKQLKMLFHCICEAGKKNCSN